MENNSRKKVAITGSTGGLGQLICSELVKENDLVLVDRNPQKSQALKDKLKKVNPDARIKTITCDLADFDSVKNAVNALIAEDIDVLMLNSGVYNVPVYKCSTGYNNVFQINFVSQYYLARQLIEQSKSLKKVIATSSVAHNYGVLDEADVDYSSRSKSSKLYGNSKRFLTFALYEYFKCVSDAKLAIAHPGVTLTNMTNHYPKIINPIVKLGIKVLFPSPKKAIRGILQAVDDNCAYMEWIGPKVFNVWGKPKKCKLKTCGISESKRIGEIADEIYKKLR